VQILRLALRVSFASRRCVRLRAAEKSGGASAATKIEAGADAHRGLKRRSLRPSPATTIEFGEGSSSFTPRCRWT